MRDRGPPRIWDDAKISALEDLWCVWGKTEEEIALELQVTPKAVSVVKRYLGLKLTPQAKALRYKKGIIQGKRKHRAPTLAQIRRVEAGRRMP